MKQFARLFFFAVIVTAGFSLSAEGTPIPSPATADVLKLAKSGVGDDIILSYVQNGKQAFHLTPDDILALKDAKVGNEVIKAMLVHDAATPPTTTTTSTIDPNPTPEVIIPVYGYPGPYFYPWYRHHWGYGW